MAVKLIILLLVSVFATRAEDIISASAEDDNDVQTAESGIINTYSSLPQLLRRGPYEQYHNDVDHYGPPPKPQPSIGINTQSVVSPKVEFTRFLEAFLKLKSELLSRFQSLLNENWELGRTIFNIVIGKVQKLQVFLLKGVSLLRRFLEFVLKFFTEWGLTLPSFMLGASAPENSQFTYGILADAAASITNFSKQ